MITESGRGASVNGKPPVSKTGTAGSTPAAPALFDSMAGVEGSPDQNWGAATNRSGDILGRGGWRPERATRVEAPTPAAPALFDSMAGVEGSAKPQLEATRPAPAIVWW